MADPEPKDHDDRPPPPLHVPADLAAIYARVYAGHRQGLFTLALSVTGCPARAEDAVHDAFVRVCRSGRNGAAVADPVAYVFSAVRNAAVDQVRRGRPVAGAGGPASIFNGSAATHGTAAAGPRTSAAAPADDRPEAAAEAAERRAAVAAAVERLPPDQREAVVLRVYAGLTFAQAAAVTGAPIATIATRYRRALERLRGQLEKLL